MEYIVDMFFNKFKRNTKLETSIAEILKEHSLIVSVAESCTGGLCAKRITDVPGASQVFDCGVVSYANSIKNKLLNVREEDLEKYGAVSETVAKQMAKGVLELSGADIGVSITGIAGPDNDGSEKPVGLSYIAVAYKDEVVCTEFMTARKDRDYNRFANSSKAFDVVRKIIDKF